LSRKAHPPNQEQEQEQLVGARLVHKPVLAHRSRLPNAFFYRRITPEVQQRPPPPPPYAMNNAAPRAADGVPSVRRVYIEISDDEGDVGMNLPSAHRSQPAIYPHLPDAANLPRQVLKQDELGAFIIDDGDEFDVNDADLAQAMMEQFSRERDGQAQVPRPAVSPELLPENIPPEQETRIQCIDHVVAVFPGICRDYVSELYDTKAQSSDFLIGHIFEDKVEKGLLYPTAKNTQKSQKRKRGLDEDEEAARKYGAADRVIAEGANGLRPFM